MADTGERFAELNRLRRENAELRRALAECRSRSEVLGRVERYAARGRSALIRQDFDDAADVLRDILGAAGAS